MKTIDLRCVLQDTTTAIGLAIGLSDRQTVRGELAYDPRVNHVESERVVDGVRYITVEMASGAWLTIPEAALVDAR